MVAVALANTLFFSVPTGEARGRVALYLLITMAPFAVMAPIIGPLLDRFRHGRRYAIAGTMLARCFATWVLAGAVVSGELSLYPAAFACLVSSKAYGVTRSATVPRLLPEGGTLVEVNARISLAGIVAGTLGAGLAGLLSLIGPGWSLRAAFLVFAAGIVLALRLPAKVDSTEGETRTTLSLDDTGPDSPAYQRGVGCRHRAAGQRRAAGVLRLPAAVPRVPAAREPGGRAGRHRGPGHRRRRGRDRERDGYDDRLAAAHPRPADGDRRRPRHRHVHRAGRRDLLRPLTVLAVAFAAGLAQSLGKLSLDAIVQRDVPEAVRTSAFARSETLLQLSLGGGRRDRHRAAAQRSGRTGDCGRGTGGHADHHGAGSRAAPPLEGGLMERRRLGRTGHESSVLIYGAAALGEVTQEVADASVQEALDAGINHIDVAASYGEAELRLGPLMSHIKASCPDLYLATKTGDRDAEGAWASINRSLERLQTDRVDLLQLHAIGDLDELDKVTAKGGALEAAMRAQDEGLVGAVGITGHGDGAPATHLEALRRHPFVTVLTPMNVVLHRDAAFRAGYEELADEVARQDAGLMLIKTVSRQNWARGQERRYTTWYEPFDDPASITAAVSWALSLPGVTGLATPGDVGLLGMVIEAERSRIDADEAAARARRRAGVQLAVHRHGHLAGGEAAHVAALPGRLDGVPVVVGAHVGDGVDLRAGIQDDETRQRRAGPPATAGARDLDPVGVQPLPGLPERLLGIGPVGRQPEVRPPHPARLPRHLGRGAAEQVQREGGRPARRAAGAAGRGRAPGVRTAASARRPRQRSTARAPLTLAHKLANTGRGGRAADTVSGCPRPAT